MTLIPGIATKGPLTAMLALVLLWSGCQSALLSYSGAMVRDSARIAVVDGAQRSGEYRSPDLTIDYRAVRNGDELELSGVAQYTAKIRNAYRLIPHFSLSVFLLDRNGTVLRERGILTPGSDDPGNPMRFAERIPLPPGTASIAFSYTGQAASGSHIGPFWNVPIVR